MCLRLVPAPVMLLCMMLLQGMPAPVAAVTRPALPATGTSAAPRTVQVRVTDPVGAPRENITPDDSGNPPLSLDTCFYFWSNGSFQGGKFCFNRMSGGPADTESIFIEDERNYAGAQYNGVQIIDTPHGIGVTSCIDPGYSYCSQATFAPNIGAGVYDLHYWSDGTDGHVACYPRTSVTVDASGAWSIAPLPCGLIPPASSGMLPWRPHHTTRLSDGLSASVDLADGHLDLSASSLSLPGRGQSALDLGQTWDSVLAQSGVTSTAGAGWVDSLTPNLGGMLTGTLTYTDSSGAVWPFTYTGSLSASPPYTQYTVAPGLPYTLTASTAGYTLSNILSGQMLTFDSQGRYLATTDAYGNAATVTYTNGLPTMWTAAGGRALSLTYNANGLLSDVQSPLWQASGGSQGQHITYGYNSGGQLATLTRGAGSTDALTTTFGYNGSQLSSVTTPISGHTWSIGYDSSGRVTSLTSPVSGTLGQVGYTPAYTTTFSYNPGQTVVVEGAGTTGALTTTYTLDGEGEATAIADGLGDTSRYTYDQDHDVLTRQDANGNTTTNYYHYVGPTGSVGLITETLTPPVGAFYPWSVPNQLATTYQYNASNDLIETDLPGGGITRQSYDGHHSVISSTVLMLIQTPQCSARPRRSGMQRIGGGGIVPHALCPTYFTWQATKTTYDPYGERITTVDGRGIDTSSDFYPTVSLGTCQNGDTCPLSYTTSYTYTLQGDLASESTPPLVTTLNGITTTMPVTTSYSYDADGEQIATTAANGDTTTTSYNHLGQVVSTSLPAVQDWTGHIITPTDTTTYDGEGNVIQQVDGNGDVTTSSYDPLGRLIAQTNPVSGTTIYTYSATEQIALHDPQGNVTQSSYDPAGHLILTTDPTGATTQYQYDAAGNTVAMTTGTPLAITQVETRSYDALNRVITDTVGAPGVPISTTVTSYDLDGNVAQVQQPNSNVTFNTYNADDQLNTVEVDPAPVMTASAPLFESYAYDIVGNVRSFEDFDNRVQQNTYDAANRLLQTTSSYGGTTTLTTTYGYDPDGNQISRILTQTIGGAPLTTHTYTATVNTADWTTATREDGLLTAYGYDGAGQQRTQTILNSSPPVTTTLNAEGLQTSQVEGLAGQGPYSSSFGYNANDLPLTETLPGGSGIQAGYGYDGDSRLITQTLSGPATATAPLSNTYAYAYTPASWTTTVTSTLNGLTTTQTMTHDALGRLTSVQGTGSTTPLSVTYDGNGNILNTVTNGITTTYYYSSTYPNLLLATYTAGQPAATYYSYDGSGHVLSITNTLTGTMGISDSLGYDLQGRLVAVSMKDGTLVSWGYNSAGQRSSYTVSKGGLISLQQTFQYRGDELADATISTTAGYTTDSYLYDQSGNPLELIRVPRGGAPQRCWYEVDGRGNVVALTDLTGTVVDRYSYDAWGTPTSVSETVPQRLRYAGYWYDQELGTYWVSVREYAPTLKRWLAPDPSQQDGVRTYVYAGDDPIDLIDPTGQASGTTTPSATATPVPCSAYKAQTVCEGGSTPPPSATATPSHASPPAGSQKPLIVVIYAAGTTIPRAYYLTGGNVTEIPLYEIRVGVTMYALPVAVIGRPATGAYSEGAPGGIGLGKLAGQEIRVTDRGLNIVRNHLNRFGDDAANEAMVRRLQTALDNNERVSGADASFYLHEISEATMMDQGIEYEIAHAAALAKYDVSPYSVYDPEVIRAYWNESGFNQNWLDFWEIEGGQ